MRRYIEAILGAADRVDDVLQTVVERLLNDPQQIDNRKSFVTTAVRNAAIDERRAADRRTIREAHYAFIHERSESAEDRAGIEQVLNLLDDAVRELPLLTQALFYGHYVTGRSQRDLAVDYGLHRSTVEKRIAKARQHCRRRLTGLFE